MTRETWGIVLATCLSSVVRLTYGPSATWMCQFPSVGSLSLEMVLQEVIA